MFQAQKISKSYHSRPILHQISFDLGAGECLGITGENGSGKSTLLRILAQTIPADSGHILYRGRSVINDRRFLRQKLGYVPQSCDLLPELTAERQLKLWSSACGFRYQIPESVSEILGLKELLKVKIGEMSGGMQQRISIAQALLTSPDILIMDEATSGLDSAYRESLLSWLKDYLHGGGRIVWCTHRKEEFDCLCSNVLTISSGIASIL